MSLYLPLDEMIERTTAFQADLASHFLNQLTFASPRAELASLSATLVVEHAHSILLLIAAEKPSSALALVRVQFEALLHGAWLLFGASDAAVAKFVAPISPDAIKEPDLFPTVTEILKSIEGRAPMPLFRALSEFKAGAWSAMNSFTHGLLRPMLGHLHGYHPGLLSTSIQNSNGSAMFATLLLAQSTNSHALALAVVSLSRKYADVLPPMKHPSLAEAFAPR